MGWAMALLSIPLTLFVLLVLPAWLWIHYRSKSKGHSGFDQQDMQRLIQLNQDALAMRERINTLEAILDAEQPGWRDN